MKPKKRQGLRKIGTTHNKRGTKSRGPKVNLTDGTNKTKRPATLSHITDSSQLEGGVSTYNEWINKRSKAGEENPLEGGEHIYT
jgi:hypothetical protein